MKRSCYLFRLCFLVPAVSLNANAQQLNLWGKVTDKRGEPILAANIYLKQEPHKGTASDINGNFSLNCVSDKAEKDTLIISFIGYKTRNIPMTHIDPTRDIIVVMEEDDRKLIEVVIKANPSLSREFSVKEVSRYDIYDTPSSAGDALKMVTMLPASTNVSESANTELRGSSGDLSRVVLNEVPVYKPVRNSQINGIGNFSLFNTEMIDKQNVYASNPPLTYSNATAGLVEIGTIRKLPARETAISLSLANAGFLHSQPIGKKNFLQVYGNYQFSKPYLWVNFNNKDVNKFSSIDAGVNFHIDVSDKIMMNLYSYFIDETYGANDYSYTFSGTVDASKTRNFNVLNLKYKLRNGFISFNNGTDFSREKFAFGNIRSDQKNYYVYSNVDFKFYITPSWNLQAGFSHEYSDIHYNSQFPRYFYAVRPNAPSYLFKNGISNNNVEFYLYNRLRLFDKLILGIGLRKNIPVDSQSGYLSYQTNLKYNLNGCNSFLISWGEYNGYSVPYYNIQSFSPISTRQLSAEYLYERNNFSFQFATYYKRENADDYFRETDITENVVRKIWGVELSLTKKYKALTGSLAYTYLYSRFKKGKAWYNFSNRMNYIIKAFVSYSHKTIGTFSLSCTARPGLYYTPVLIGEETDTGIYKPIYGEYNTKQLGNYCCLDFSYNKVFPLKKSSLILFFTANNMMNTKNESSLMYNFDYSSLVEYKYYNRLSFYAGFQLRF